MVVSFVRAIARELQRALDNYPAGTARAREDADTSEKLAGDPEALREWNESKLRLPGGEDLTAGEALSMAQTLRAMATPSLESLKDRREALTNWQEVTASVVDQQYLDDWLHETAFRSLYGGRLPEDIA